MKKHRWLIAYLIMFLLINLLLLTGFPFVHSDESWLAGLTRNMTDSGSLSVTETFFDLHPRYPHAIKTLFHVLQMPFILVFGYNVFSVRLMSLVFSTLSLVLFYMLLSVSLKKRRLAFWGTVLLSIDCQFIYTSHFARPEAVILPIMLGVYLLLSSNRKHAVLYSAILTGLSIGIHPNSFLVASMGGAVLLSRGVLRSRELSQKTHDPKQESTSIDKNQPAPREDSPQPKARTGVTSLKDFGIFVGVVGMFCAVFVALSLSFDSGFFSHYLNYGSEFGVTSSFAEKTREIIPYFQRLFYGVSGTYYTAEIRLQIILFPVLIALGALRVIFSKRTDHLPPIAAIAGILTGMTFIGRFSQPYVVFFFPFAYLLLMQLISDIGRIKKLSHPAAVQGGIIAVLGLALLAFSVSEVSSSLKAPSYDGYISQIAAHVPPDGKTIGNLNTEFYFENGALLDYRNLTYLRGAGMSFEEYVRQNDVEYLIISDELEFIYSRRPNWNGIYGNINFLNELSDFLDRRCTLLYEFTDNQYGIRIVSFQNGETDFAVRIYRVNPET